MTPSHLRLSSRMRKLCVKRKNPLMRNKWEKKPQEKQQRRDPSPRMDRLAIAVCID